MLEKMNYFTHVVHIRRCIKRPISQLQLLQNNYDRQAKQHQDRYYDLGNLCLHTKQTGAPLLSKAGTGTHLTSIYHTNNVLEPLCSTLTKHSLHRLFIAAMASV